MLTSFTKTPILRVEESYNRLLSPNCRFRRLFAICIRPDIELTLAYSGLAIVAHRRTVSGSLRLWL